MLDKLKITYDDHPLDNEKTLQEFNEVTRGASTVPQIFIDGNLIGGFSELTELHMDGELDHLISEV